MDVNQKGVVPKETVDDASVRVRQRAVIDVYENDRVESRMLEDEEVIIVAVEA